MKKTKLKLNHSWHSMYIKLCACEVHKQTRKRIDTKRSFREFTFNQGSIFFFVSYIVTNYYNYDESQKYFCVESLRRIFPANE